MLLIWWIVRTLNPLAAFLAVVVAPVNLVAEVRLVVVLLTISRRRSPRAEASTVELR